MKLATNEWIGDIYVATCVKGGLQLRIKSYIFYTIIIVHFLYNIFRMVLSVLGYIWNSQKVLGFRVVCMSIRIKWSKWGKFGAYGILLIFDILSP